MAEENQQQPVDAENSTRASKTSPEEHLKHLLKIGHKDNSVIIKRFIAENAGISSKLDQILKDFKLKKNR